MTKTWEYPNAQHRGMVNKMLLPSTNIQTAFYKAKKAIPQLWAWLVDHSQTLLA